MKHLQFFLVIFLVLYNNLANSIEIIQDEETENILYEIAKPIYAAANLDPKSLKIILYNSPEPNAFVPGSGGQYIFISTGLISYSKDPSVIAGVIAHEVGHIVGGHALGMKEEMINQRNKFLLTSALGLIAGVAGKSSEVAIGTVSGADMAALTGTLAYSRSQESAADNSAIRYMNKLNIDKNGLIGFLSMLNIEDRSFNSDVPVYFRSHPLSKDRINNIKNSKSGSSSSSYLDPLAGKYERVVIKIRAFVNKASVTIKEYGNDTSIIGIYARSIAYFKNGQTQNSLAEINTLLQREPTNPYFNELKAQVLYETGQIQESVRYYEIAKKYSPTKASYFDLVLSQSLIDSNKDLNKAISLLKQVISHDNRNAGAWHLLGKAYFKTNDKNNANLAFGWSSLLQGDIQTARKMANTVEKNTSDKFIISKLKELRDAIASEPETE